MITVVLCSIIGTDMVGANDTLQPVHHFERPIPVPTGTVFRWRDKAYCHAYDSGQTIIYAEQRFEDAPDDQ